MQLILRNASMRSLRFLQPPVFSQHHLPQGLHIQQLEAALEGVQQAVLLHQAQLTGKGTAVAVEVVRQLDAGKRDAEGQAPGAFAFIQEEKMEVETDMSGLMIPGLCT